MSTRSRDSILTRLNVFLMVLLVISIALTVITFVYFADKTESSSLPSANDVRQSLGVMGDYFGGLLNPIYGFLGLLALLVTISFQAKEMEQSRKEAENSAAALSSQIQHMKNEALKNDLYRMIVLVKEEIDKLLRESHLITHGDEVVGVTFEMLFGPDKVASYFDSVSSINDASDAHFYKRINSLCDLLNEIAFYLERYQEHGGDSSIRTYFSSRYGSYALSLYQKKYLSVVAKNIICNVVRTPT